MPNVPELLDVKELARRLRLSQSAVRRFAYRGELPFIKLGPRLLFDPAAVEAFLGQHTKRREPIHPSDIRLALGLPSPKARPSVEPQPQPIPQGMPDPFAQQPQEAPPPAPVTSQPIPPVEPQEDTTEQTQQRFRDAFRKAFNEPKQP